MNFFRFQSHSSLLTMVIIMIYLKYTEPVKNAGEVALRKPHFKEFANTNSVSI